MTGEKVRPLDKDQVQKLCKMLVDGAKPPDVFDTFADDEQGKQITHLEGSIELDPRSDEKSMVLQAIETAKGEIPGDLSQEIYKNIQQNGFATLRIKISRDGKLDLFCLPSLGDQPSPCMPMDFFATQPESTHDSAPDSAKKEAETVLGAINEELSKVLAQANFSISIGKMNIRGGEGHPVDITVENVEISSSQEKPTQQ